METVSGVYSPHLAGFGALREQDAWLLGHLGIVPLFSQTTFPESGMKHWFLCDIWLTEHVCYVKALPKLGPSQAHVISCLMSPKNIRLGDSS